MNCLFVGSFVIKCFCVWNELVLLFYYLQQKAIFSKSWGGPEKDRFFGFFLVFYFFFGFFLKSFCFHGPLFFLLFILSSLLFFLHLRW